MLCCVKLCKSRYVQHDFSSVSLNSNKLDFQKPGSLHWFCAFQPLHDNKTRKVEVCIAGHSRTLAWQDFSFQYRKWICKSKPFRTGCSRLRLQREKIWYHYVWKWDHFFINLGFNVNSLQDIIESEKSNVRNSATISHCSVFMQFKAQDLLKLAWN